MSVDGCITKRPSFDIDFKEFIQNRIVRISEEMTSKDYRVKQRESVAIYEQICAVLDDDHKNLLREYSDRLNAEQVCAEDVMYVTGLVDGAKMKEAISQDALLKLLGY